MNSINNSMFNKPKLYCLHFNECDPKKCTALKLGKLNLVTIITRIKDPLKKAIILNPFSHRLLSKNDRDSIIRFGLIVIDCSWKNLIKFYDFNMECSRKLPPFIAVNPINYGKWEKLSSAEALAASLFIVQFEDYARLILSKFSWGPEFIKLNF